MSSQPNQKPPVTVDIVIPVLNEAHVIRQSVEKLRSYLHNNSFPYRWQILIVDNGSTDGTIERARELSKVYTEVQSLHLTQRGRGRALRHAWLQSRADVVCYMDVDLSTDLRHLKPLIDSIAAGGYDVATGSRLQKQSQTTRSANREFISRVYNLLVKASLFTKFSDAQCGFKAMSRRAVEHIIPQVEDQSWFFDTELLVLAEKQGFRICDIPVRWVEDDDSRVKIMKTGWDDIKGLARLRLMLWRGKYASAAEAPKRKQI